MSLDCRDNLRSTRPSPIFQKCDPDFYMEGGYSRWPFFQYLAQRFGVTVRQQRLRAGRCGRRQRDRRAPGGARGSGHDPQRRLRRLVDDASMTGYGWITALWTRRYRRCTGAVTPGVTTTTTSRLGARQRRPPRDAVHRVPARRRRPPSSLLRRDALPDRGDPGGDVSKPAFYWDGRRQLAVPLSINGSTATASIPWDTCTWRRARAISPCRTPRRTSMAPTSSSPGSLTVDTTRRPAALTAAAADPTCGQVVPVTSSSVAPAIRSSGRSS